MIRFAVIRERYLPFSTAERHFEAGLEALLERNVAVSLYTREHPDTRLQLIEPVICNPPFAGTLSRQRGFARAACRAVARDKPDLVQAHDRVPCCDVFLASDGVHATRLEQYARIAAPLNRLAWRLHPQHRHVLRAEQRLFTNPWLRAAICSCGMVAEDIHRRFGVAMERLPVLRRAVDSDAFHPGLRSLRGWVRERHHISDSATLFLASGDDYDRSGIPAALAAAARLPPTTHLLVIGSDAHVARHVRRARELGVGERVTFVPAQTEPKPYFGAADVFVLPALYDPCADAALQAMACGMPVITGTMTGVADLATEHDAGLACDALDVQALAAHMSALLDESLRTRMGANARKAVAPLNHAALTLQLVLLYRDFLAAVTPAEANEGSSPQQDATARMLARPAMRDSAEGKTPTLAAAEIVPPPALADAAAELPADVDAGPAFPDVPTRHDTPPEIGADPSAAVQAGGSDEARRAT